MIDISKKNNIQSLRALNNADEVAKALFQWFAERQKASREMPVRIASYRTGKRAREIRRVFEKLEDLGCGRLIKGTRGHETRMVWDSNILSLAAVARGEQSSVETEIPSGPTLEEAEGTHEPNIPRGFVVHRYHLRSDTIVEIALPTDISSTEASRLAAFVRSLPFEQAGK